MDFFESAQSVVTTPSSADPHSANTPWDTPSTPDEPRATMELGYTAAWRQVLALFEQAQHLNAQCEGVTKRVFGFGLSIFGSRYSSSSRLEEARTWVRQAVIARAQECFAPRSGRFIIDPIDLEEALGSKAGFPCSRGGRVQAEERQPLNEDFDPDAIWRWCEEQFGGDAGKRVGWQQAAAGLVDLLGLRRHRPDMRGAKLVVAFRTHSEGLPLKREKRYSYDTQSSILDIRAHLASFAGWAGDEATEDALLHATHLVLDGKRSVETREKLEFGPGMQWVTFLEKIEIHFNPALSVKFREFIAEFGCKE